MTKRRLTYCLVTSSCVLLLAAGAAVRMFPLQARALGPGPRSDESTDEPIQREVKRWSADDDDSDDWLRASQGRAGKSERPRRIIDVNKEALVIMAQALEEIGDSYAIMGFSGHGRDNVATMRRAGVTTVPEDATRLVEAVDRLSRPGPDRDAQLAATKAIFGPDPAGFILEAAARRQPAPAPR